MKQYTHTGQKLTSATAFLIGDLLNWVTQKKRVRYSTDEGANIREGTLRHLIKSPDNFGFIHDEEVRDSFVRITTTTGIEEVLPFMGIVELMREGLFVPET